AEDGIRDFHVTGVQTCALPISKPIPIDAFQLGSNVAACRGPCCSYICCRSARGHIERTSMARSALLGNSLVKKYWMALTGLFLRSEERRVGKGVRCRWEQAQVQ